MIGIIGVVGLSACKDVPTSSRFLTPEEMLHSIEVNYPVVNLALVPPYDTVTISAIAKNAFGETFTDSLTITLSTTSAQVVIYPDGVIRGIAQTSASGVAVTASATYQGVTKTATVQVVVTNVANPPKLKSFSLGIAPSDTFKVPRYSGPLGSPLPTLTPVILDSSDRSIPRAILAYRPKDPSVYSVDIGASGVKWTPSTSGYMIVSTRTGLTTVYAKAMIYGTPVLDSFTLQIHESLEAMVYITDTLRSIPDVVIYRGGLVVWLNAYTRDSLDIVFDEPEKAKAVTGTSFWTYFLPIDGEGNIPPFQADSSILGQSNQIHQSNLRGRLFLEPGTYPWHSTRFPAAKGIIRVR